MTIQIYQMLAFSSQNGRRQNNYSPSLLFSISYLTLSPQKAYLTMTLSQKIFMVHGNFPKYDASLEKSSNFV